MSAGNGEPGTGNRERGTGNGKWETGPGKRTALPPYRLTALFVGALALLCTPSSASPQSPDLAARVDSIFAQYDNTRSPGCAVGAIRAGEFVFARGYGMADLEHGIPLSATSVFRIGSTSKQFTAAAMVLLEREGRLSLDDDIRDYLPELPDYGETVTIRHLLHHTSGVRDYLTLMHLAGYRDADFATDEDVVAMLARQQELNFMPGEDHLYSNSGYFLLSQIVKRVTGTSLREYADAAIFRPLGMLHTHFHDDHTEIVPNRAIGYAPNSRGGFRISMTTLGMIGDGGVFTSVADLLKWDSLFYDAGANLPPYRANSDFWHSMLTRGVLNSGDTLDYALGLVHGDYRGLQTVGHSGAFVGFRAEMVRFPRERFTVICLCNLSRTNPSRLARSVAAVFLEDRMAPPEDPDSEREPGERASEEPAERLSRVEMASYVGSYYSPELDVSYKIHAVADSLRLTVGNDLDGRLTKLDVDVLDRDGIKLRFQRNEAGNVEGFQLDAGRVRNLRFVRQ
jgi:CubicO group peptidase (beta-lactamase class C family)